MFKKTLKLLLITFILLPFFISLAEAKRVSSKLAPAEWTKMSIKTTRKIKNIELRGISGSSKDDVFAVGFDEENTTGVILYYDGNPEGIWQEIIPEKKKKNLYAVWGGSKNGVFVVGDGGTILSNYKEKDWPPMNPEIQANLKGVWGSSPKDIFAVGDGGTILHYDGNASGKWLIKDSGVPSNLNGIWGTSSKNVFAVGDGGTVLRYNGIKWEKILKDDNYGNLKGIWGSSEKNIFAVGGKGEKGIILRSTDGGKTWPSKKNVEINLNGIWGSSSDNIFAVGYNGTVVIIRYDNKKCKTVLQKLETDENLYAVWVSQNPHVLVVGRSWAGKTYSAMMGYVCDSCDGVGIVGVELQLCNPTCVRWCNQITGTDGIYNAIKQECELSSTETYKFKFAHNSFKEEERDIEVPVGTWIENHTFLLPNTDYERCISGVISEITTIGQKQFSQVLNGVEVKLEKKSCSGWETTEYDDQITEVGGHYHYTIGSEEENGTYRVIPTKTGYAFNPEYDSLEIVIPQDLNTIESYDFTGVAQ